MRLCVAGDDVVEVAQRLKRLSEACTRAGIDEACYGCPGATRAVHVELRVSEAGTAYEAVCAAAASLLRGESDCEFELEDGSSVRLRSTKATEDLNAEFGGHHGSH